MAERRRDRHSTETGTGRRCRFEILACDKRIIIGSIDDIKNIPKIGQSIFRVRLARRNGKQRQKHHQFKIENNHFGLTDKGKKRGNKFRKRN